jgi:hypothetical protein
VTLQYANRDVKPAAGWSLVRRGTTPSRAGVDYAELRRAHQPLPTNNFEDSNLKAIYKSLNFDLTNAAVDQLVTVRVVLLHAMVLVYFVMRWGPDFSHPAPYWGG